MGFSYFICGVLILVAALVVYFLCKQWKLAVIGAAVLVAVTVVAGIVTKREAIDNAITFHQYLNGWERIATKTVVQCTRDGSCSNTYDCDPYTVEVPSTSCDSKGKCTTTYHTETRYHSCPYSDEEDYYSITTSFGNTNIEGSRFPKDAHRHGWRGPIPEWLIAEVGTGAPVFWEQAAARISSGHPGPVSTRVVYANYVLASDQSILHQYSNSIEGYKHRGMLPVLNSSIEDYYHAKKVYFVGVPTNCYNDWQTRMQYMDAALGTERQGDAHLVIVNANMVTDADDYTYSLKAFWLDPKVFHENALSKNSVVIVVGTTDGRTVAWSRAFTGMPTGNENLVVALSQMRNLPLLPEKIIGNTYSTIDNGVVKSYHTDGAIESAMWNPSYGFHRTSMSGKHGQTGYQYLLSDVAVDSGAKCGFVLLIGVLCAVFIGIAFGLRASAREEERYNRYNNNNRYYHTKPRFR